MLCNGIYWPLVGRLVEIVWSKVDEAFAGDQLSGL